MISNRSAKPRPTHAHEFKLWRRPTSAPLLCSAELASSAVASLGISASMGFPYGLHPGILVGGTSCSVLMIRNFILSRLISTTIAQLSLLKLLEQIAQARRQFGRENAIKFLKLAAHNSPHLFAVQRVLVSLDRAHD
jgi:hypothetical protein